VTVALYMDVHVPRAITNGLRIRGVDVLTAQQDGFRQAADERLLDRAGELGRVLFSQDDDLLAEAKRRQVEGVQFTGVIYAHQMRITIGQCVHILS
jgi:predicted nuclease of predicted toxin-antitoxin system